MKKKMFFLCGILVVLMSTGCENITDKSEQERDKNQVSSVTTNENANNLIYNIEFPEYGGEIDEIIRYSTALEDENVSNTKMMKKIYTIDKDGNKDVAIELQSELGLDDEHVLKQNDKRLEEPYMIVYDNGCVEYNAIYQGDENVENIPSEDECKKVAQDLIDKIGADKDIVITSVGYDSVTNENTGEEKIIARTVYFDKLIDGILVNGSRAAIVRIGEDGKIAKVMVANTKIKEECNISDEVALSLQDAIDAANNRYGQLGFSDEIEVSGEIDINQASVEYWMDVTPYSENDVILPIYVLKSIRDDGTVIADCMEQAVMNK